MPPMNLTPRRGYTLLEVLVAGLVLGVALTSSARLMHALHLKHRQLQHRLQALTEAENVLERLTATPWDELTPAGVAEHRLSNTARQRLPDGELTIEIVDEAAAPASKRVVVEVSWRDVRGEPTAPLRLAAWVYPDRAAAVSSQEDER
jgi:prepilin-type N-terminal cleavage/methylation domain-containing protein